MITGGEGAKDVRLVLLWPVGASAAHAAAAPISLSLTKAVPDSAVFGRHDDGHKKDNWLPTTPASQACASLCTAFPAAVPATGSSATRAPAAVCRGSSRRELDDEVEGAEDDKDGRQEEEGKRVGDSEADEVFERFTFDVEQERLVNELGSALVRGVA